MTWFQAAVLGVIQGFTEFLPISSSGHLIVIPRLLGWNADGLAFDVTIHLATLCAILVGLRKDLFSLVKSFVADPRDHLFWKVIAATVPAVLGGLFLSGDVLDGLRTAEVVGVTLMLWGVILYVADLFLGHQKTLTKRVEAVHWWQAIFIGVMQVFALIPGTSRSGVTISTGLFSGLDRTTAARFSFLLAIPAIAGAGVLTALDVAKNGLDVPLSSLMVGFLFSFVTGTLVIRWMLQMLTRISYRGFAIYRVVLGLLILLFLR